MIQAIPHHGDAATIPMSAIDVRAQIRTRNGLDRDSLQGLADSIKVHGVLQPLLVTPSPEPGRYYLIAGERRLLAASMAGLAELPVMIRTGRPVDLAAAQAVENLQREDLTLADIADGLEALAKEPAFGTWKAVAKALGKSPAWVSKHRKVLQYKPQTRQAMREGYTRDLELLNALDTLERSRHADAPALLAAQLDGLADGRTTRTTVALALQQLAAKRQPTRDQAADGEGADEPGDDGQADEAPAADKVPAVRIRLDLNDAAAILRALKAHGGNAELAARFKAAIEALGPNPYGRPQ